MKKELFIPFIVAGLGVAFLLISLLVFLSRGNGALIRKKLKIGGLIISLSGLAAGCPGPTCYDPVANNQFSIDSSQGYRELLLNLSEENTITGKLYEPIGTDFTYRIFNQASESVQQGPILATDGAFDSSNEQFTITVDSSLSDGVYDLCLYTGSLSPDTSLGNCYDKFQLTIVR